MRIHLYSACGFEVHKDANAAITILFAGFTKLGLGQSDQPPAEIAFPLFTSLGAFNSWMESASSNQEALSLREAEPAAE